MEPGRTPFPSRSHCVPFLVSMAILILLWGAFPSPARGAKLTLSCGGVGQEFALCRSGAQSWAARTGHEVEVVSAPSDSNERLALYQQLLAARSADIDVFTIDVIWPGLLGKEFLDLKPYVDAESLRDHFPAIVEANSVAGALVAMPWFVDAGLLYYRKDLLERHGAPVPATWEELGTTARRIQAEERKQGNNIWGYVFQGKAYEGLTCNTLEWFASRGISLVDSQGKISLSAHPDAASALDLAARWVSDVAPRGVLTYGEEEARGAFQSGRALFMRNWPYAWALAQAPESRVRNRVGVAPLPRGAGDRGRHVGTLGGWSLAVSARSRHPGLAAQLVTWLTSSDEQKRRALEGGFNPSRRSLYGDPQLLSANPFLGQLKVGS